MPQVRKRALSERSARRCETACGKQCKCRCGGIMHGAQRFAADGLDEADRSWFEKLPKDDPHHLKEQPAKPLQGTLSGVWVNPRRKRAPYP